MCPLVFCNYVILGGHILNISKTIFTKLVFWSANQRSTTWCSFASILYNLDIISIPLHLEQLRCSNIKNSRKFLVGHITVGKFTFRKIECSFAGVLYTFSICNIYFHLEQPQCVNLKTICQFLVAQICVGKFTLIKIGFKKKFRHY